MPIEATVSFIHTQLVCRMSAFTPPPRPPPSPLSEIATPKKTSKHRWHPKKAIDSEHGSQPGAIPPPFSIDRSIDPNTPTQSMNGSDLGGARLGLSAAAALLLLLLEALHFIVNCESTQTGQNAAVDRLGARLTPS